LYRLDEQSEWSEGVLHVFVGENAVVENKAASTVHLIPVKPELLKFSIPMDKWIDMQQQAQRQQAEAQQAAQRAAIMRSTQAGTPPPATR
jgi:hypothetical protein